MRERVIAQGKPGIAPKLQHLRGGRIFFKPLRVDEAINWRRSGSLKRFNDAVRNVFTSESRWQRPVSGQVVECQCDFGRNLLALPPGEMLGRLRMPEDDAIRMHIAQRLTCNIVIASSVYIAFSFGAGNHAYATHKSKRLLYSRKSIRITFWRWRPGPLAQWPHPLQTSRHWRRCLRAFGRPH